jgi:hypothetical protein
MLRKPCSSRHLICRVARCLSGCGFAWGCRPARVFLAAALPPLRASRLDPMLVSVDRRETPVPEHRHIAGFHSKPFGKGRFARRSVVLTRRFARYAPGCDRRSRASGLAEQEPGAEKPLPQPVLTVTSQPSRLTLGRSATVMQSTARTATLSTMPETRSSGPVAAVAARLPRLDLNCTL